MFFFSFLQLNVCASLCGRMFVQLHIGTLLKLIFSVLIWKPIPVQYSSHTSAIWKLEAFSAQTLTMASGRRFFVHILYSGIFSEQERAGAISKVLIWLLYYKPVIHSLFSFSSVWTISGSSVPQNAPRCSTVSFEWNGDLKQHIQAR